jgi:hypothetical protein
MGSRISRYPTAMGGYMSIFKTQFIVHCVSAVENMWFSPGTPVSFTNKSNRHDVTEILLKVALNTITLTLSAE